ERQRERCGHGSCPGRSVGQSCDWTLDCWSVLFEPNHWRRVVNGDLTEWADEVIEIQAERNAGDLAVYEERPRKFILRGEILRHRNDEHSPLPAGKEMRRLPHVGSTRLDLVVGSDGNIQFLLYISIEISDEKTAAAFLVFKPAFESAGNARAELLPRFRDLLPQQQRAADDRAGGAQDRKSTRLNSSHVAISYAV